MWQNPYVDLFKKFFFFDNQNITKVGQVTEELDSSIAKKVYTIKGATAASNYIQAPTGSMKSLGLTGKYIYLLVQGNEEKNFTIHLDFVLSTANTLRISLSNLYKIEKLKDPFSLLLPITLTKDKWTCIILDVNHLKEKHKFKGEHTLKSFTITSTIRVSRIMTSDNIYNGEEIPRDVNFKLLKGQRWLDMYELIMIGNEDVLLRKRNKSEEKDAHKDIISEKTASNATITKKIRDSEEKKRKLEQILNKENQPSNVKPISNEPLFNLHKIVGFSAKSCPKIMWGKDPKEKDMYYASGSIIIKYTAGIQTFFMGHASNVLSFDTNSQHLASIDKTALRLWNINSKLIVEITHNLNVAHTIAISQDSSHLAVAGLDNHNRDIIVVWEVAGLLANKIEPIAKQLSFFNILSLKFSPFESERLVSCGHENIRFWRIKNGHLPGTAVVLNKYSRDSTFLCIDFEWGYSHIEPLQNSGSKKLFAGSKSGMVFQINYFTQELEAVYQVHSASINCISVNEAFCVTGSEDNILRVWPLDFSEYYIEAKHDSPLISCCISPDGMLVASGTHEGSIGITDLTKQSYAIIQRSHVDEVVAASYHIPLKSLITVANDKTIRVWNMESYEQTYEFTSLQEMPLCISSSVKNNTFICGFDSGILRVFDVDKTACIQEEKPHNTALKCVCFSGDSGLIACSYKGGNCILLSSNNNAYQQVKAFKVDNNEENCQCMFSPNSKYLAVMSDNGLSITIFSIDDFSVISQIKGLGIITNYTFVNPYVINVCTDDCLLKQYSIFTAKILKKHKLDAAATSICTTPNGKYSNVIVNKKFYTICNYESAFNPKQQFQWNSCDIMFSLFSSDCDKMMFGGSEGIYICSFMGDKTPFTDEDKYRDEIAALSAKKAEIAKTTVYKKIGASPLVEHTPKQINRDQSLCNFDLIRLSSSLATFLKVETDEVRSKEYQPMTLSESVRSIKKEKNLCYNHFMPCKDSKQEVEDKDLKPTTSAALKRLRIAGYNGNSINNLVWVEDEKAIIYSVNNKLIYEKISTLEQKEICSHRAEISTFAISHKKTYIASATGDDKSEIIITNLASNNSLKVHFHEHGVQSIAFSSSELTMFSLSVYNDQSLAVWDHIKGVVLSSYLLKSIMNSMHYIDGALYTVGSNTLLIWKPTKNGEYENAAYDYTTSAGQFTTVSQLNQNTAIVGTSYGSAITFDIHNKSFSNEFPLCEGEIGVMCSGYNYIIIGGTTNVVYKWENSKYIFSDKPKTLHVDSPIIAISSTRNGKSSIVGTELGNIWYLNWDEQSSNKLICSHFGASINCMGIDVAEVPLLITSGSDDTVKIWEQTNVELLAQFEVPNAKCMSLAVNAKLHYCIASFSDGNVRIFKMDELKYCGKVKVSNASLNTIALTPGGQSILAGDEKGKVLLVNIDTWGPLTVRQQELSTLDSAITAIDCIVAERFLVAQRNGKVMVWEIENSHKKTTDDAYSLSKDVQFALIDTYNMIENPFDLNEHELEDTLNQEVYTNMTMHAKFLSSSTYVCCSEGLQCLAFRSIGSHSVSV